MFRNAPVPLTIVYFKVIMVGTVDAGASGNGPELPCTRILIIPLSSESVIIPVRTARPLM
jgi:hypothetical protein